MPQFRYKYLLSLMNADSVKINFYCREKEMYKKILILGVLLILSACSLFGSYYEPEAVGIGKDVNELKLSPCACMQIEVIKDVPSWFWETI